MQLVKLVLLYYQNVTFKIRRHFKCWDSNIALAFLLFIHIVRVLFLSLIFNIWNKLKNLSYKNGLFSPRKKINIQTRFNHYGNILPIIIIVLYGSSLKRTINLYYDLPSTKITKERIKINLIIDYSSTAHTSTFSIFL